LARGDLPLDKGRLFGAELAGIQKAGILLLLEARVVAWEAGCWFIDLRDFDCLTAAWRWSDQV